MDHHPTWSDGHCDADPSQPGFNRIRLGQLVSMARRGFFGNFSDFPFLPGFRAGTCVAFVAFHRATAAASGANGSGSFNSGVALALPGQALYWMVFPLACT